MVGVSVIIPAYITTQDGLRYLAECLDSCDGQADEVVVWDDGSPLTTEALRNEYHWVEFHRGPHAGKGYSRNSAVKSIRTELLYPLDADDMLAGDAISRLLSRWTGTPLYSDVIKQFDCEGGLRKYHQLQAFDCDTSCDHAVAPVNVLHSKKQWAYIGGWDEANNLYEDWDYNARLFWEFCAHKIDAGLVIYRQHDGQSTNTSSFERHRAWLYVKNRIGAYTRRQAMAGCCGKRRTSTSNSKEPNVMPSVTGVVVDSRSVDVSLTAQEASLGDPGPGNVWARYVGGRGMGRHSRRGSSSRKVYKVQYGDLVQARAEDVVTEAEFKSGIKKHCGLIEVQVVPVSIASSVAPTPAPTTARPSVVRKPVKVVERRSVQNESLEAMTADLASMSIREIRDAISVMDATTIAQLVDAEKQGKNRVGAIKVMEKELDKAASKE